MSASYRDYNVIRSIGSGSYGEVFLVKKKREKKQYVVKSIKLSSDTEVTAAMQEASLLSQLQHPNIVSYHESFQDDEGYLHIIMGYCEGGDLHTRLKSYHGNLLPEDHVVKWLVQIALAIQYLHDRNIMHRDLKTQNIFLSRHDIIKVGDLGIAKVLESSLDLAHTIVGTPYYMSPELFASKPYNYKSDIWALGCCLYEMATLKQAFSASNISSLMYKIMTGKIPSLPDCFTRELNGLVSNMLSLSADDRPSIHQILHLSYIKTHIQQFLSQHGNKRKQEPATNISPSPKPSPKPHPLSAKQPQALEIEVSPRLSYAREKRRRQKQERGKLQPHPLLATPTVNDGAIGREGVMERREGMEGNEREEVLTLLDTTLHDDITLHHKPHPLVMNDDGMDRIRQRMSALMSDCVSVMGADVVSKALVVMATSNDIEYDIKGLIGGELCSQYLIKLQQLKLFEDSIS